jgi:hypothetical protein
MKTLKKLTSTLVLSSLFFNPVMAGYDKSIMPEKRLLENKREAASSFIDKEMVQKIIDLYPRNSVDTEKMLTLFSDIKMNRCSSKLISGIKDELALSKDSDVKTALLSLRYHDYLDDVSLGLLLKANEIKNFPVTAAENAELSGDEEASVEKVYKEQLKVFRNSANCPEDSYRSLVLALANASPKYLKSLKALNRLAYKKDILTENEFKKLEKLRMNKVHEWPITLADYTSTLSNLRQKFPALAKESSELITKTKFRQKSSWRTVLYEKFDSTQIILLANIVNNLKTRLESKSVTININYEDGATEVINLSAMEKFRFILKLLRKELATVNNGSLLNGRKATYYDLITAAYEVGYLKSEDLTQFASLQEIWNPSKTPKEKAMFWAKTFGGVASVLLPPPYGFISVLAIMLIDQQVKEAPIEKDPDDDLF